MGVCTVRYQSARSFRKSAECTAAKLKKVPWLDKSVGLFLSWLQRAGAGVSSDASRSAELYSNIYSERTKWTLVGNIWRRFQNKHAPSGKLIAALAGVFMWDNEKIQDDEMHRCGLELQSLDNVTRPGPSSGTSGHSEPGWEIVMDKKDFKVWRRPIANSHLYEYRVLGSYKDVTPRQFFNVQLDTEYRKKWDALVIKLEVVDRDVNTGSEVVHWATHFPYPIVQGC
ncbi:hypothetical protein WMY93_021034 [Mugilogobius chulae]|uniref:START domain-containing protein n=1 Tax=Mugilogobius chulae TaxID=88201 RepID=A0AAW0NE33_9GOBI